MNWAKSNITRWTAGDFLITEEAPDRDGRSFRLASPRMAAEMFATLTEAKAGAARLNELELVREENERLRAELEHYRNDGSWARHAMTEDFGLNADGSEPDVAAQRPAADCIAASVVGADHERIVNHASPIRRSHRMKFLSWITSRVKSAVLQGFAEALDELQLTTDESSDPLNALEKRMTLPAPSGNGELKTVRKGK